MSTSVVRSWTERFQNLSSAPLADLVRQLERRIHVLSQIERISAVLDLVASVQAAITQDGPILVGHEDRTWNGEFDEGEVRLGPGGLENHEGKALTVAEAAALDGFSVTEMEQSLAEAVQRHLARLG